MRSAALFAAAAPAACAAAMGRGWSGDFLLGDDPAAPVARYVTQLQDHFDGANPRRWEQAYFINDTFWAGPGSGAPVFLYIGGEGSLYGSSVTRGLHMGWAAQTKALVLALEHRYYGCHNTSACPYDAAELGTAPRHLRFLSAQQALADLAAFRATMAAELRLTPADKWVAYGGSYPGNLAGWARAKYPGSFHAAIASSAPVTAVWDMTSFNDIVAKAYAAPSAGGSAACAAAIATGHRRVHDLLADRHGRAQLAALFPHRAPNASFLDDAANRRVFAGCGVASFPAQGNAPGCTEPACNIEKICGVMAGAGAGEPLDRLAALSAAQAPPPGELGWGDGCEIDFTGAMPPLSGNNSYWDYWGWQTCNEFGFYQTCEAKSDCPYVQDLITVQGGGAHQDDFCRARFNLSEGDVRGAVAATNRYFGERAPTGPVPPTRIFWPNGEVDPWHGQGVLESPAASQPTLLVAGASHCQWMRAPGDGDSASLREARDTIFKQLLQWLQE